MKSKEESTPAQFSSGAVWPALAALLAIPALVAQAQTTPLTPAAAPAAEEDVVELSPFTIEAERETGWVATQTLGGSRLKTDFKDVSQSIEVLTPEFMQDLAANSFEEALLYTTNIEGREEITDGDGLGYGVFQPRNTGRVRGLTNATLSRNFFIGIMPTDNYYLDRITIARGPNAILFGLGSPSGIVDVSLKRANLRKDALGAEFQVSSEGSYRASFDLNRVIIPDVLAARIAGVTYTNHTFRKPNEDSQDRLYGALQFKPFPKTTLSVHAERADWETDRSPRILPVDSYTTWLNASAISRGKYGDMFAFDNSKTTNQPAGLQPGLTQLGTDPVFARSGAVAVHVIGSNPISGDIRSWNNAVTVREPYNQSNRPEVLTFDRISTSIPDQNVFGWDANLFGRSRAQKLESDLVSAFLEQQITRNLFVELAYNRETFEEQTSSNGIATNTLQVDANRYLPAAAAAGPWVENPNYGRYYVQGRATGSEFQESREDWRATLSYELDFRENEGWLGKILGRHRFAGLMSGAVSDRQGQQLQRRMHNPNVQTGEVNQSWFSGTVYQAGPLAFPGNTPPTGIAGIPASLLSGNSATAVANRNALTALGFNVGTQNWATNGNRDYNTRFYLGGTDGNVGASNFNPMDTVWNLTSPTGDPFGAYLWETPYYTTDGWNLRGATGPEGSRQKVDTQMLAWQGFLLDDRIVLLYGYRKDEATSAGIDSAYTNYQDWSGLRPSSRDAHFGAYGVPQSGTTRSAGIVVHPLSWLSFHYNDSTTFTPNIGKWDPFGREYPGEEGEGTDLGIAFGFFGDNLRLRLNYFEANTGPTRAGNTGFNDPLRDQVWNIEGTMRDLDPQLPLDPAVGSGGFRDRGRSEYWVMFDSDAEGYEVELSWRVRPNFDIIVNAAKQDAIESNIGIEWFDYIDARLPVWQALSVPEGGEGNPRDVDGDGVIGTWTWANAPRDGTNPATKTFQQYYEEDMVSQSMAFIQAVDGRARSASRSERANLILGYRFDEGRLKGLRSTVAVRYRSKPVLNYHTYVIDPGTNTLGYDLDNPIYGKSEFYTDAGVSYSGNLKAFDGVRYRVALNVRNLLGDDDPVPVKAFTTGDSVAYSTVEPRTWILTVGFDL